MTTTRHAPARRRRSTGGRPRRRATRGQALRRRLALLLGAVVLGLVAAAVMTPWLDKAVQELALPLRHEDIIRQQARDKDLDPSLIAAVIYTESRFVDQTSSAGAKGLMQILPSTADYIAQKSGGTQFEQGDLATPQINIAYGSWYLNYLLRKYRGSEVLALAAYNAGEGKLDEWLRTAAARGETFTAARIPFPETRAYVKKVLQARAQYRREYARELGL
ncbi:MAG TPA: lytic transglycosylase domain-containing protein [Solirubrobacteraceae bacterium]|nr:lytic transglycosylase domain-containing protein [Solirubrobacteraceae bacterium]